jgi:hypothetical protein
MIITYTLTQDPQPFISSQFVLTVRTNITLAFEIEKKDVIKQPLKQPLNLAV